MRRQRIPQIKAFSIWLLLRDLLRESSCARSAIFALVCIKSNAAAERKKEANKNVDVIFNVAVEVICNVRRCRREDSARAHWHGIAHQ